MKKIFIFLLLFLPSLCFAYRGTNIFLEPKHQTVGQQINMETLSSVTISVEPAFDPGELINRVDCYLNYDLVQSLPAQPYIFSLSPQKGGWNLVRIAVYISGKNKPENKIFYLVKEGSGGRVLQTNSYYENSSAPTNPYAPIQTPQKSKKSNNKKAQLWGGLIACGLGFVLHEQGVSSEKSIEREVAIYNDPNGSINPPWKYDYSSRVKNAASLKSWGTALEYGGCGVAGLAILGINLF